MGDCNLCRMKQIRRDAKRNKMRVTVLHDTNFKLGGVNVYVHPRDVKITAAVVRDEAIHDKHFVAWFMAFGAMCECD